MQALAAMLTRRTLSKCLKTAPAVTVAAQRGIFSAEYLKVDAFKQSKAFQRSNLQEPADKVIQKMRDQMSATESFVTTLDLKNLLICAESDDDLRLLDQAIARYETQSNCLEYRFPAQFARLLYTLNKCDLALEIVLSKTKHKDMRGFDHIIACLLFENKRYMDVVKVAEHSNSLVIANENELSNLVNAFALEALAMIGSPEAYEKAKELAKLIKPEADRLGRTTKLMAYMALNQGDTSAADEYLQKTDETHFTAQNLRIKYLFKEEKYDEALELLTQLSQTRFSLFPDTIQLLKQCTEKFSPEQSALMTTVLNNMQNSEALRNQNQLDFFIRSPRLRVLDENGNALRGFGGQQGGFGGGNRFGGNMQQGGYGGQQGGYGGQQGGYGGQQGGGGRQGGFGGQQQGGFGGQQGGYGGRQGGFGGQQSGGYGGQQGGFGGRQGGFGGQQQQGFGYASAGGQPGGFGQSSRFGGRPASGFGEDSSFGGGQIAQPANSGFGGSQQGGNSYMGYQAQRPGGQQQQPRRTNSFDDEDAY